MSDPGGDLYGSSSSNGAGAGGTGVHGASTNGAGAGTGGPGRDEGGGGGGLRAGNPLGVVALVAGTVGILFNVLFTLVQAVVVGQGMYDLLATFAVTHSVLAILIALATIALGVVALLRPGAPRGAAAAGTALGGAALVTVLTGFLYSGVIAATGF